MRIKELDIAKSLLILLLYWFHIPRIYLGWLHETNSVVAAIDDINGKLFTCFFMAAFFIISGYFLNTQKSFGEATKRDALTLLFPSLTLSLVSNVLYSVYSGGWHWRFILYTQAGYWSDNLGFWFLSALFISKLIVQLLIRYVKKTPVILIIVLILCAVGLILRSHTKPIYSILHYQEAFMLTPMTLIGYYCKQSHIEPSRRNCTYLSIGFVLTIIALWLSRSPIQGFNCDAYFSVDYIPMALWLGLSGTALIIYISSWLVRLKILNRLGQLTLPMFCFNFFFIDFSLRTLKPIIDHGFVWLYIASVFLLSTTCGFLLSLLFNTKYLKWTLGKFEPKK